MTEQIQAELWQILVMFYCGLALMLFFTGRDAILRRCAGLRRVAVVVNLVSWLCAGFLFSEFLYRSSHGTVTLYGVAAMAAGILLWKKVIYGILFR